MATPLYYPPLQNGLQKTLDAQLLTGVTASATLNNVTGIQNKKGIMVIDRVDSNNNLTPNKREYISFDGTSGNTVITLVRGLAGSTDQDHAVGAIVEFVNDITQQQAILDGLSLTVKTDGTLNKATGATIDTGTDDATIVTPKAIADSSLITSADLPVKATATENVAGTDDAKFVTALANVPAFNNSLYRQAIINGNFDVWQRGTSIANTTANSYAADRWYVDTATAGDDKTVSQQTSDVNGSKFSCRVQRLAGETGHTVLRLSQALESQDSIKLRGKKLTLSFYLKVGANFSATSNILTAKILTGTGTDEKATAFTGSSEAATVDITATTTSVKYTLTTSAVIGATVTQVGVTFSYDPTGTAGANDWFELNQVQLCAGDVAPPFMPKSFEDELRACQRYYEKSAGGIGGIIESTTTASFFWNFKTEKRITPTITLGATNPTIIEFGYGGRTGSGSTISEHTFVDVYGGWFKINGFSGITAYKTSTTYTNTLFIASSEL